MCIVCYEKIKVILEAYCGLTSTKLESFKKAVKNAFDQIKHYCKVLPR